MLKYIRSLQRNSGIKYATSAMNRKRGKTASSPNWKGQSRDDGSDSEGTKPKSKKRKEKKHNTASHQANGADQERPSTSVAAFSRGRYRSTGSRSSIESNRSSRLSSTCSTEDEDLPGFYYDREKKRHFRIQPGTSSVPHAITQEKIQKIEAEEKRQKMLRQQFGAVRIRQLSCTPRRSHRSSNMVDVEYRRSLRTGAGKSLKWISDVMRFRMPCLRTCSVRKVFPEPSDMYQSIEHMRAMQTSPTYDRLLGLWSLSGTVMQRIQLLNLKPAMTADSICDDETVGATCKPGIDVNPFGAVIMKSLSKVTHLCWAPMNSAEDCSSCVLYTTMCILGNHPSLALFRKLDSNSVEQLVSTEFNLGKNAAWTCAWNKFSQKFSIGSERKAFLVDLKTRRLWELKTGKGDVLSQTFTHQTGSSLYSGTRRGLICQHDLRSSSTHYVSSFSHKSSVCHLHLLRDENYLLASDFSGKINMWDIRKAKVVMEYPGHKNDYSRIPFGVDETETIIYSAGQDCFTRIWSLQDGSLLHTIPPPYPASREIIPVLSYSGRWTGRNIPGLLMGIKDEIRFYSL